MSGQVLDRHLAQSAVIPQDGGACMSCRARFCGVAHLVAAPFIMIYGEQLSVTVCRACAKHIRAASIQHRIWENIRQAVSAASKTP